MDRVEQVNSFFKPSKGKMENLRKSVSLIAGFIRNKLQLHVQDESVCNCDVELKDMNNINLNKDV